ncbi:DUF3012 family protein [Sinobacterium caligoides]|uniref:DUF3012 family protein n=1 Tax=Sinobacterium caligoides TaxID=933926 RepID=A0A3N2DZJ4_9GAMM|nr:DUF3012 domain-containing protein [Sinobacterium caligoides]ROS05197.1 DUF3012 family protein [Sinobacterium caligoides]
MKKLLLLLATLSFITACTPEVGSDKWCKSVEAKSKGEVTANEASDYAKHCLVRND